MVQDWSAQPAFHDGVLVDATYQVQMRCSATAACTTTTGASASVLVYPGDSTDLNLTLVNQPAGSAFLRITARPQPPMMSGYDFFRYTFPPAPPANLAGTITLACDQGIGAPVGSTVQVTDTQFPAVGSAFWYWVGHSNTTAGSKAALGRRSDNTIRIAPVSCP